MTKTYYPWSSLVNVGDEFTITNEAGIKLVRQLVYAANKSKKYGGAKFAHSKVDNVVTVRRVS